MTYSTPRRVRRGAVFSRDTTYTGARAGGTYLKSKTQQQKVYLRYTAYGIRGMV